MPLHNETCRVATCLILAALFASLVEHANQSAQSAVKLFQGLQFQYLHVVLGMQACHPQLQMRTTTHSIRSHQPAMISTSSEPVPDPPHGAHPSFASILPFLHARSVVASLACPFTILTSWTMSLNFKRSTKLFRHPCCCCNLRNLTAIFL